MIVDGLWIDNPMSQIFMIVPEFDIIKGDSDENNDMITFKAVDIDDIKLISLFDEKIAEKIMYELTTILPKIVFSIPQISEAIYNIKKIDMDTIKYLNDVNQKYLSDKIKTNDYDFDMNKFFINIYFLARTALRKGAKKINKNFYSDFSKDFGEDLMNYIFDQKTIYYPYPLQINKNIDISKGE